MEAEQRYDLHMRVKENLVNEVQSSVKAWQKDHYHKVRQKPYRIGMSLTTSFVSANYGSIERKERYRGYVQESPETVVETLR